MNASIRTASLTALTGASPLVSIAGCGSGDSGESGDDTAGGEVTAPR